MPKSLVKSSLIILSCILILCSCRKIIKTNDAAQPVVFTNGMVVTAHPIASQIGIDILKQGGNAFDAAIAVQFALAVVYPRAGNLGGGGFAVYRTSNRKNGALDFREKAPIAAHEKMYLDENEDVIDKLSSLGHHSVGIPGTVEGMFQLHQKFGVLQWDKLLNPAIQIAHNGFSLTKKEAEKLNQYQSEFLSLNDSNMVFINHDGWKEGDSIKLPKLGFTLQRIKNKRADAFYSSLTADMLVNQIQKGGGIITHQDLEKYEAVWRPAVSGEYKDYTIISMPPPSSGGIALIQLLKGSEIYDFKSMHHNSAEAIHIMAELERRVYADRATFLGDPDFVDVPINKLLNTLYITERNSSINIREATPSSIIKEGKVDIIESIETTHFSIIDKDRNAIGITTTLNGNYGSKVFVEEAGFFLNNEMDDFSAKPGVPNQFGLVGAEANAIAPEKRMLSSMTPTIVEKNGELYMVLGTPGGSTIITSVYQTILNVVEHEMNIQEAVNAKKVHHQWLPDRILHETDAFTDSATITLQNLGHQLEKRPIIGRVDAILVFNDSLLHGAADPRGDDIAIGY